MQHSFALQVYEASSSPKLLRVARILWSCPSDREDALSDMLIKAVNASHRFDGRNLIGWLKVILHRIKSEQCRIGFNRRGTKAENAARRAGGARMTYVDPHAGYADHLADLCDPEGILIALEGSRAL